MVQVRGYMMTTMGLAGPSGSLRPLSLTPMTPPRNSQRHPVIRVSAKKGGKVGKSKKGGGKKGPGSLMDVPVTPAPVPVALLPPSQQTSTIMTTLVLIESHRREVGAIIDPAMEDVEITDASRIVYEGPFALLFADTDGNVAYANEQAQRFLSPDPSSATPTDPPTTWDDAVSSKLDDLVSICPAPPSQDGTARVVKDATVVGRVSQSTAGGARCWSVAGPSGDAMGTAIVFTTWKTTAGETVDAGVPDAPVGGVGVVPTEGVAEGAEGEEMGAALATAERAVQTVGNKIREMKENGLGNKDAEVVEAVEELLQWKARVAELEKRA